MAGAHNVGRLYDRWDRRSVAWEGRRPIIDQPRPGMPSQSRADPGRHLAAGSDGQWRDDRDRGVRDAQQFRGNGANSTVMRAPPAVQMPWPREEFANQDDRARYAQQRVQPPPFGGNERWEVRGDGRSVFDRPRVNLQQVRPAPPVQAPQRIIPAVAGVPVERAPLQPQRVLPQSRGVSPPVMTNPGRTGRPATASPGRVMERPSLNPGPNLQHSATRPQVRGAEARRNSGACSGKRQRVGER
jgi:hypothetical protein